MPEFARPAIDVVVVSNRGPLNFRPGEDEPAGNGPRQDGPPPEDAGDQKTAGPAEHPVGRAAGGLVVALGPGVQSSGALWVAAAMSDADKEAAARAEARDGPGAIINAEGFRLRSLVLDPADRAGYYDVVANGTLWYLTHGLWDLPRRPRFDRHWHEAWARYRLINRRFADAVAEVAPEGATVIVQDYHLALVAGMLAPRRRDLRTATFMHTPWCTPEELAVLPDAVSAELMATLVDGGPCGFHSPRWAKRYRACADEVLHRPAQAFVAPAASDGEELARVAASAACRAELAHLDAVLAGRRFIVRVDRIELSKNILRGLWAFHAMLETHPELVGTVTFGVFVYPSRLGLADYQAYGAEIATLVNYLNATWARDGWIPIMLDTADNHCRSVAALCRYDALLVNPVRDGLNLVAIEGPVVNDRDGTVVLSRQAGCFDLLGEHVLAINPFDVAATAEALAVAVAMPAGEREMRAAGLRKATRRLTPTSWWDQLVDAAGGSPNADVVAR